VIHVRFKQIHPHVQRMSDNFSVFLARNERVHKEYQIRCSYRGIYTVGLQEIALEDPLHLFRITLKVWYRTFYVYPRILNLGRIPSIIEGGTEKAHGSFQGTVPDTSLFSRLRDYRRGESLHHLYWKKFASTGIPYLKSYDTSTEPGLTVYLDLRQREQGLQAMAVEDTSVEILVALVRFFFDRGIRTRIRAPGRTLYSYTGASREQFHDFYTSTTRLIFQDTVSPVELYRIEQQTSAVLFITHFIDTELFALLERSVGSDSLLAVILNLTGQELTVHTQRYLQRLQERGAGMLIVHGAETIVSDLEGR
jgi:uncharacterized protein (DUF58 family)